MSRLSPSSDDDLDERRRLFLERNRAAASRCRSKKKLWMTHLEQKADNLASANTALLVEVSKLRQELARLKSMLHAHQDCPITRQQQKMSPAEAVMPDETPSQVVRILSPVNDEAIAMAALSSMADCIGSAHFAPGSEHVPASVDEISSEQVTYVEQIGSEEQIALDPDQLTKTLQMAVDLSASNVVADDLT